MLLEEFIGLFFPIHHGAVALDPLGAPERLSFVTRHLDKHGYAKLDELFAHIGRMVDHRRLDGKLHALREQQLVIGRVVLAAVRNRTRFHGGHCRWDMPILLLDARHRDAVERVERVEQAHRVGSYQVDVAERLLNHGDVVGDASAQRRDHRPVSLCLRRVRGRDDYKIKLHVSSIIP